MDRDRPGKRRFCSRRRHGGPGAEHDHSDRQAWTRSHHRAADREERSHRMSEKTRVLVVDDSALMRKLLPQILQRESTIEVVGTAMDGTFVLKKIEELR